jgi:hypothetical protein
MLYEDSGSFLPIIRDVEVRNMRVKKGGKIGVLLEGYPQSKVENLRLIDVTIESVNVPYKFTNASGIRFRNVTINNKKIEL